MTWEEVAGLDEAKKELREVVDFLRHPKRFSRLGARVPRGILLYGPPGTGKTLLAKAVAHESGASFYSQSASAFVEMFAGLGAARIRKLFEQARNDAPSIIFIDELDAVGMKRMGGGLNREQDQTLNQLLVELDGFNETEGDQVIVMGASNRLQDLDPALLRPGRFDRQILVSPPDLAGRQEILGVHTRGKPLSADVDLHLVARQTAGLTGADLANVANEAAIFAAPRRPQRHLAGELRGGDGAGRRRASAAPGRDREGASDPRVPRGRPRRHGVPDGRSRCRRPRSSRAATRSATRSTCPRRIATSTRREEFIDWMKIVLAGRAAEQVVFGRVTNGAANDLEKVTDLARSMVFEYGMSEGDVSRTMRADNYALSEETKRMRDTEQARLTDEAYAEAVRLLAEAPLGARPRRRRADGEGDARSGTSSRRCSRTSSRSRARATRCGTVRVLPQPAPQLEQA